MHKTNSTSQQNQSKTQSKESKGSKESSKTTVKTQNLRFNSQQNKIPNTVSSTMMMNQPLSSIDDETIINPSIQEVKSNKHLHAIYEINDTKSAIKDSENKLPPNTVSNHQEINNSIHQATNPTFNYNSPEKTTPKKSSFPKRMSEQPAQLNSNKNTGGENREALTKPKSKKNYSEMKANIYASYSKNIDDCFAVMKAGKTDWKSNFSSIVNDQTLFIENEFGFTTTPQSEVANHLTRLFKFWILYHAFKLDAYKIPLNVFLRQIKQSSNQVMDSLFMFEEEISNLLLKHYGKKALLSEFKTLRTLYKNNQIMEIEKTRNLGGEGDLSEEEVNFEVISTILQHDIYDIGSEETKQLIAKQAQEKYFFEPKNEHNNEVVESNNQSEHKMTIRYIDVDPTKLASIKKSKDDGLNKTHNKVILSIKKDEAMAKSMDSYYTIYSLGSKVWKECIDPIMNDKELFLWDKDNLILKPLNDFASTIVSNYKAWLLFNVSSLYDYRDHTSLACFLRIVSNSLRQINSDDHGLYLHDLIRVVKQFYSNEEILAEIKSLNAKYNTDFPEEVSKITNEKFAELFNHFEFKLESPATKEFLERMKQSIMKTTVEDDPNKSKDISIKNTDKEYGNELEFQSKKNSESGKKSKQRRKSSVSKKKPPQILEDNEPQINEVKVPTVLTSSKKPISSTLPPQLSSHHQILNLNDDNFNNTVETSTYLYNNNINKIDYFGNQSKDLIEGNTNTNQEVEQVEIDIIFKKYERKIEDWFTQYLNNKHKGEWREEVKKLTHDETLMKWDDDLWGLFPVNEVGKVLLQKYKLCVMSLFVNVSEYKTPLYLFLRIVNNHKKLHLDNELMFHVCLEEVVNLLYSKKDILGELRYLKEKYPNHNKTKYPLEDPNSKEDNQFLFTHEHYFALFSHEEYDMDSPYSKQIAKDYMDQMKALFAKMSLESNGNKGVNYPEEAMTKQEKIFSKQKNDYIDRLMTEFLTKPANNSNNSIESKTQVNPGLLVDEKTPVVKNDFELQNNLSFGNFPRPNLSITPKFNNINDAAAETLMEKEDRTSSSKPRDQIKPSSKANQIQTTLSFDGSIKSKKESKLEGEESLISTLQLQNPRNELDRVIDEDKYARNFPFSERKQLPSERFSAIQVNKYHRTMYKQGEKNSLGLVKDQLYSKPSSTAPNADSGLFSNEVTMLQDYSNLNNDLMLDSKLEGKVTPKTKTSLQNNEEKDLYSKFKKALAPRKYESVIVVSEKDSVDNDDFEYNKICDVQRDYQGSKSKWKDINLRKLIDLNKFANLPKSSLLYLSMIPYDVVAELDKTIADLRNRNAHLERLRAVKAVSPSKIESDLGIVNNTRNWENFKIERQKAEFNLIAGKFKDDTEELQEEKEVRENTMRRRKSKAKRKENRKESVSSESENQHQLEKEDVKYSEQSKEASTEYSNFDDGKLKNLEKKYKDNTLFKDKLNYDIIVDELIQEKSNDDKASINTKASNYRRKKSKAKRVTYNSNDKNKQTDVNKESTEMQDIEMDGKSKRNPNKAKTSEEEESKNSKIDIKNVSEKSKKSMKGKESSSGGKEQLDKSGFDIKDRSQSEDPQLVKTLRSNKKSRKTKPKTLLKLHPKDPNEETTNDEKNSKYSGLSKSKNKLKGRKTKYSQYLNKKTNNNEENEEVDTKKIDNQDAEETSNSNEAEDKDQLEIVQKKRAKSKSINKIKNK